MMEAVQLQNNQSIIPRRHDGKLSVFVFLADRFCGVFSLAVFKPPIMSVNLRYVTEFTMYVFYRIRSKFNSILYFISNRALQM